MVTGFDEPSGASVDQFSDVLYIADTNNSVVKCVNRSDNSITPLTLTKALPTNKRPIKLTKLSAAPGSNKLCIQLEFSKEQHINSEAGSSATVGAQGGVKVVETDIKLGQLDFAIQFEMIGHHGRITIKLKVFTCSDEGACFMTRRNIIVQVSAGDAAEHCVSVSLSEA